VPEQARERAAHTDLVAQPIDVAQHRIGRVADHVRPRLVQTGERDLRRATLQVERHLPHRVLEGRILRARSVGAGQQRIPAFEASHDLRIEARRRGRLLREAVVAIGERRESQIGVLGGGARRHVGFDARERRVADGGVAVERRKELAVLLLGGQHARRRLARLREGTVGARADLPGAVHARCQ